MKEYKLKKDFCGKKKGERFKVSTTEIVWYYEGAKISVMTSNSVILEEQISDADLLILVKAKGFVKGAKVKGKGILKTDPIVNTMAVSGRVENSLLDFIIYNKITEEWAEIEQPEAYSAENELYINGVSKPIYKGGVNYQVKLDDLTYQHGYADGIDKFKEGFKYFLTRLAAEDYIKLQKVVKELPFKVGHKFPDRTQFKGWKGLTSAKAYNVSFASTGFFDAAVITGFVLHNDKPCITINAFQDSLNYLVDLDQFITKYVSLGGITYKVEKGFINPTNGVSPLITRNTLETVLQLLKDIDTK